MEHNIKSADLNNISIIRYQCYEKIIIQSTEVLVQSAILKFLLQIDTNK